MLQDLACSSSDVVLNVASELVRAESCMQQDCSYALRAESFNSMLKSIFAATAATVAFAGSAVAGPFYVNAERNDGFVGSDHSGAINELHIGVEGQLAPNVTGYAQAGPAYLQPSGGDGEMEISGKAGGAVGIGENASIYGEVSFVTGDDDSNGYGLKTGVKYSF